MLRLSSEGVCWVVWSEMSGPESSVFVCSGVMQINSIIMVKLVFLEVFFCFIHLVPAVISLSGVNRVAPRQKARMCP